MRWASVAVGSFGFCLASCSLTADLDGYSGGPVVRDSATTDSSADSTADSTVNDTGAIDSGAIDTGTVDTGGIDSAKDSTLDAPVDTGTDTGGDAPVDSGTPYRRTVTIDGVNDFDSATNKLTTTTPSFDAYVSWDAAALYVGYAGVDIGTGATANKWLLVYLDADPGAGAGATKTEVYGAQQQQLPTGFAADAYFAWKTDDSFQQFKKYSGGAWTTLATSGVTWKRTAATSYVEMRIPFTALGVTPTKLGVVTFMLNEDSTGPWTWAGLYTGSFVDGLSATATPKAIGYYLLSDLGSAAAPNATAHRKP
ncbi:MAG: hypothetical protein JNL79_35625 [Myxococcales bacterium]|nr:hypothetical protein [Myxococcales bacterium]